MSAINPIIMVVEDDFVDVELVKRGIRSRNLPYEVDVNSDGAAALETLRSDKFTVAQREQLVILLDINMPGMNGHQFLENLRNDEQLKRTIVFVLTTSDHATDKAKAYDKNVAGYFLKTNLSGLLDTVAAYIENVQFPPLNAEPT